MKAEELMIGDWVHVEAHRGFNAQNVKVETIPDNDGDYEYGHHYGHIGAWLESDDNDFRDVEAKHLRPIPLTPEILEKNGFVQSPHFKEVYRLINYDEYLRVAINMKNGRYLNIIKTFEDGSEEFNYNTPIPKFVHELQHALRLCGIDKEIEL